LSTTSTCLSCRNPIHAGADSCPHCGVPVPSQLRYTTEPSRRAPSIAGRAAGLAIVVVLGLLGVIWIAIAVVLLRASQRSGPGGDSFLVAILGFWDLLLGGYALFAVKQTVQRRYHTQGQLGLLAVPPSIVLGLLALISSGYFASGRQR
jgi:hypothetical protein